MLTTRDSWPRCLLAARCCLTVMDMIDFEWVQNLREREREREREERERERDTDTEGGRERGKEKRKREREREGGSKRAIMYVYR